MEAKEVRDTKMKAVFTIVESDKLDKPLFRRIGTGFVNRDASLNVFLDVFRIRWNDVRGLYR